MADYTVRKISDAQYSAVSKLFVDPADGTHIAIRIPKNTWVKNVTVVKSALGGIQATGTLTMATKPSANDTVTIGSTVYTFVASPASSGDVAIGALVANSQENLVTAINDGDSFNDPHPSVTAADFSSDDMVITVTDPGVVTLATTETFTDGTDAWAAATTGSGAASTNTIGFTGNGETADADAFMVSSVFNADALGSVSCINGTALYAGGKHFTKAGGITVTTSKSTGTAGTFMVFADYVRINK